MSDDKNVYKEKARKENTGHSQFFDIVRNLAMLSVVLFHAVAAYSTVTPHWSVHDGSSIIADIIREVFDVFMMPIFFFVAGYFALPSLLRKGTWQFLTGKFKRLGIPWLFAIFAIIPIFQYFGQMKAAAGQTRHPFLGYWITYLESFGTSRIGFLTPESVNQWHYWFISLLLVFFIAFALLLSAKNRWLRNPASSSISEPVRMRPIIKVLSVAAALTSAGYLGVSLFIPDMSWVRIDLLLQFQPTHLVFYIAYFALGVFAYSRRWFAGDEFPRRLSIWVPISLLLTVGFLVTGQRIFSNPATSLDVSTALLAPFSLLRSFLCLAFLVVIIAVALRYGNRVSAFNRDLAANSYNIYLVHLVLVVMFQHTLMVWPGGPPMVKAGIVFLLALLISYGISRLINRFPRGFAVFLLGLFALMAVATK